MKHHAYESPFKMVDEEGNKYKLIVEQDDIAENPREWDNLSTMICFHRRYDLGDKHNYDDVHEMLEDLAESVGINYEDKNTYDLMTALSPYYCIKPLHLYDHSGITISTSNTYPYNDRWDAGCVGFVYISKDVALKELVEYVLDEKGERIKVEHKHDNGTITYSYQTRPLTNKTWYNRASECIDNEVKVYDQYLTGDVYGYKLKKEITVEEKCPHCNEVIKSYKEWIEEDSCWGFFGNCLEDNGILDYIPNKIVFAD